MISAINSAQSINQTRSQSIQRQSFNGLQKKVVLQSQNNSNPSFTSGFNRGILISGAVVGAVLGFLFYESGYDISKILTGLGLGAAATVGIAALRGR